MLTCNVFYKLIGFPLKQCIFIGEIWISQCNVHFNVCVYGSARVFKNGWREMRKGCAVTKSCDRGHSHHAFCSCVACLVCVCVCVFILLSVSVETAQKDVNDAVTLGCIVSIADFVALIV